MATSLVKRPIIYKTYSGPSENKSYTAGGTIGAILGSFAIDISQTGWTPVAVTLWLAPDIDKCPAIIKMDSNATARVALYRGTNNAINITKDSITIRVAYI